MSRVRNLVDFTTLTHDFDGDGTLDFSVTGTLTGGAVSSPNVPEVDLSIAPEVLEIQVAAPAAGQDTAWLWTWEQSTLPYARRTITNSPEVSVPLYRQGQYVVNNFAAYDLFDQMTQTHSLYLKWIDGAGTDNLVSWATSAGPISDSHPDINGGAATDVQRLTINVPATITLPTLTAPSVSYNVTNNGSSAYTFSGSASGDNPNIGPFYRGGTYTINITATGHPFYFTTDNGTNFTSSGYFGEYTNGVTGSRTDSGTITFTVPSDAPDTLYYQCGNHGVMRGAITVKDLAVETNINGNYVIYAQHTQEGHKTPIELRPIPSLVNQMCIVYDASVNKFVPQDLATYVENTPSFENKIREVAGTAELVVEDGSAVIAKVNVYDDSTYLPLVGNNPGDQAFATDTDILYIWDGSAWQQAGAANTDDLAEGTTNLFYTDARVNTYLSNNGYDTATNIIASITDSAPATLDTLNELAAALGDDPNFATTVTNSLADKLPLSGGTLTGPLEVQGNGNATLEWGDTTAIGALSFDTSDNPLIRSYTGKDLFFQTNGNNNRMVIESDGNVGIGDTTPQAKLEVRNDTDATDTILATAGLATAGNYHNLLLGDGPNYAVGLRRHITVSNPSYLRPRLDFVVQDTDTYLPSGREVRMSITHNGKVGIGTTNPATKLHLAGDASPTITFTSSSGPQSYIESNTVGSVGIAADESNTGVSSNINFRVDGSERMRINDAGDVFIKSANGNNNFYWDASDSYNNGQLKLGTGSGVSNEAMLAVSRNYGDITNPLVHFDITGNDGRVLRVSSDTARTDMQIFDVINNNGTTLAVRGDGNVGIGTGNPVTNLQITDSTPGSTGYSAYGHPVTGGRNGALYIEKSNSRFDWDDGLVFAGEGSSWSMRVTGRNGLITNSDTDGEIFGVHPVEGSGTTWNDTAGANNVTDAYFRVMGNGSVWVGSNKLNGLGMSSTFPANSAKEIKDQDSSALDGLYYIDVPGQGVVQVYCDMTTDGGGWTLVYKTHHINQHDFVWPSSNTYYNAGIDPRSSNNASTECNLPNKYSAYGANSSTNATEFMIEEYDYGSGDADFIYKFPFTSSVGATWESGTNGLQTNLIPASLSYTSIVDRCVDNNGVRPTTDTLSGGGSYLTDKASPGSGGNWDIGGPSTGSSGQNLKDANCNRYGGAGPGLFRSSSLLLWVR